MKREMITVTEWRQIPGYEGRYEVSDEGFVKSLNYGGKPDKICILKNIRNRGGYLIVNLCDGYGRKQFKVHRLVAQAFIPNPQNYLVINHKDENPMNNRVDNLEWCDTAYNNTYGTARKRATAHTDFKAITAHPNYKASQMQIREKMGKPVKQIKDGIVVAVYPSEKEAARKNKFCVAAINRVVHGRQKTAYGYQWQTVQNKGG